jgi:thioredoxin 1
MARFDAPINANDASFQRVVLDAPLPVAAVFWTPTEIPRKQLNTALNKIAEEYAGEVLVVKLDVDDAPQAQEEYKVDTLPQFLFFRHESLIARARGLPTAEMLRPWIEYLLERGPKPSVKASPKEEASAGGVRPFTVTDADFNRVVLKAKKPALVDFWAPWCGPCQMVAPVVKELAQEYAGRVLVAKLNVDENPDTAGRFGVKSIPTLILFRRGKEIDRVLGAQPAHVLRQRLEAML